MADLGGQSQHHGAGNANQTLLGRYLLHRLFIGHAGFKAQAAQRTQHLVTGTIHVVYGQNTLHQVKTQVLHLIQLFQAGANHVLFRRAVHISNMHDQTSGGTGRQGHRWAKCGCRAARPLVGVRRLFCMAVIVIMAMLVAVIARRMVVIMTMVMYVLGLAG